MRHTPGEDLKPKIVERIAFMLGSGVEEADRNTQLIIKQTLVPGPRRTHLRGHRFGRTLAVWTRQRPAVHCGVSLEGVPNGQLFPGNHGASLPLSRRARVSRRSLYEVVAGHGGGGGGGWRTTANNTQPTRQQMPKRPQSGMDAAPARSEGTRGPRGGPDQGQIKPPACQSGHAPYDPRRRVSRRRWDGVPGNSSVVPTGRDGAG